MRFSHFLKYNAVPEWQSHYMDYNALKDLIYTLQTDELKQGGNGGAARTGVVVIHEEDEDDSKGVKPMNKLKKKLFSNHGSNNNNNSGQGASQQQIQEQTFELDDFSNDRQLKARKHRAPSFKKVKERFFEKTSRRSSTSSDDKSVVNSYDTFLSSLTTEKLKVDDFYKRLESKFYEKFATLIKDLEKEGVLVDDQIMNIPVQPLNPPATQVSIPSTTEELRYDYSEEDLDDDDDDEEAAYYDDEDEQENTALLNYSDFNIKSQKKSLLKQSIINLYIDLCQLKSFIELNKLGFSKITKKADKVLHFNIRDELIQTEEFFKDTYTFELSTLQTLDDKINKLVEFYCFFKRNDSLNQLTLEEKLAICQNELKLKLHDHIVWERSNTWKDMLGLLSYQSNDKIEIDEKSLILQKKLKLEFYKFELPKFLKFTHCENLLIPKLFFTWKAFKLAFIFVVTAVLLGVKTFNDPAQHRCMALVECLAFLWASEALPLFVTAFLVPLLTVLFKVLKNDDGTVMGGADASSTILSAMWSSTIMILLAGFTLGEALAQYDIARVLASWLLAVAGTKPRNVLLMAMGVVFFLSMWISNVAAPVLTYSLLSPLLDPLNAESPFAKALVLGVALSADLGGMASPISSPQNIISMQYLKVYGVGWGQFFAVALPTGILALLCVWLLMCFTFKINTTKLQKFTPVRAKFTLKQYYIVVVTLGTILLWCVESKIESAFGASGEIAVLPIVLFFGTGLLSTHDLNTFPWSIVVLAMGGIALGKAVSSSGLLATIAHALQRRIEHDTVLAILCIFGVLMLVVGTFVSHTVSAIIIIPLVQQVGDKLPGANSAAILVFGCTLLASCGMALPSSGFPNVTAISMLDKKGDRFLDVPTFISRGIISSLIGFVCVITLGYGIMSSVLKGS